MRQVFEVPERGDVVLVNLPALGRSRGTSPRRAVVILSPQAYNARVGLALTCPTTPRVLGYPFEVALPKGFPLQGVILADRALSLDWRALRAQKIGALPAPLIEEILAKSRALLA